MSEFSDEQLLRRFTADPSDIALAELVKRYIDMVYSAAMRQVRDPAAAEDVTQAVFILLWQKAPGFRDARALPAWLLRVTRFAAMDANKRRNARRRHEQEASSMPSPATTDRDALAAHLDDAISALNRADQTAIALRYLNGKSLIDVAQCLGTSENTAGKRVARAVNRLRHIFAGQGVTCSADLLEKNLTRFAVIPAPAALVAAAIASGAHPSAASASAVTISKGTHLMLLATKTKSVTLVLSAIALLLLGVGLPLGFQKWWAAADSIPGSPPVPNNANGSAPTTRPAVLGQYALHLSNGVDIEIIGICRDPRRSHSWWKPDGAALPDPVADEIQFDTPPARALQKDYRQEDEYAIAWRIRFPANSGPGNSESLSLQPAPPDWLGIPTAMKAQQPLRDITMHLFYFPDAPAVVDASFAIAAGPWENIATFQGMHRTAGTIDATLASGQPPSNGSRAVVLDVNLPGLSEQFAYRLQALLANRKKELAVLGFPIKGNPQGKAWVWGRDPAEISGYLLDRSPTISGKIAAIHLAPLSAPAAAPPPAAVAGAAHVSQINDFTFVESFLATGQCLELASGQITALPPSSGRMTPQAADDLRRQLDGAGVDLVYASADKYVGLLGMGIVLVPAAPEDYLNANLKTLRNNSLLAFAVPASPSVIDTDTRRVPTFLFKTRAGDVGVLRLPPRDNNAPLQIQCKIFGKMQ